MWGVTLTVRPLRLRQANDVVTRWHSHHKASRGAVFCLGAFDGEALVGAAIVGRPVAPALDDGVTLEVTRLCTNGHRNAASFLLGAVCRTAKAMGVRRLVSYTRMDEAGTSYKAAGWRVAAQTKAKGWDTGNKRDRWLPGLYEPTTEIVDRERWEIEVKP